MKLLSHHWFNLVVAVGEPLPAGPENADGWAPATESLSLHKLQGADGEGELRLEVRKTVAKIQGSVGRSAL